MLACISPRVQACRHGATGRRAPGTAAFPIPMFQAIADSLPIAFGIVLATLPLMAVPLTLVSRGAVRVLGWFLAGYVGGFVGLAGVVILSADLLAFASADAARWTVWLRGLLGVALLGLAWHKWQGRPRQGEVAAPPAWVQVLDRLGSPGAAGLGFVLVVLNPKNALLVASGGLAIAAATPVPAAQAVALLVFSVVSCLGVAAPLLLWLTLGDRVRSPLGRLRGLLVRYDAQILTVVLAVLGLVIILGAAKSTTGAAQPSPIVAQAAGSGTGGGRLFRQLAPDSLPRETWPSAWSPSGTRAVIPLQTMVLSSSHDEVLMPLTPELELAKQLASTSSECSLPKRHLKLPL